MVLGVFGILILGPGCPADEEAGPWTLNVGVSSGVTGSPAAGSYVYDDGTAVTYNFSLEPKYGNLTVTLDGTAVANSGSVNMNNNHDLVADATIDIRGDTWSGYANHDQEPDWKKYPMSFTFTGGINLGTVTGEIEDQGDVSGTWTLDGMDVILSLDINGIPVDLVGTLSNTDYMSGTYDTTDQYGNHVTGIWILER